MISARTRPGDPGHVIRAEATKVDAQLPAAPGTNAELIRGLRETVADNAALADLLAEEIEQDRRLGRRDARSAPGRRVGPAG